MANSKRKRDDQEDGEEREIQYSPSNLFITEAKPIRSVNPNSHVFRCKTCGKEFSTFQGLGGHCASHTNKKPNSVSNKLSHECHTCHKKFETGQALGGHMTIHREKGESSKGSSLKSDVIDEEKSVGEGLRGDCSTLITRNFFSMEPMWINPEPVEVVPVLERADSWLEFKLAPLGGEYNSSACGVVNII